MNLKDAMWLLVFLHRMSFNAEIVPKQSGCTLDQEVEIIVK